MLKAFANANDFVAFKLDVDHVETESELAHQLLVDDSITSLVDEFFIEIHFQCEGIIKFVV